VFSDTYLSLENLADVLTECFSHHPNFTQVPLQSTCADL